MLSIVNRLSSELSVSLKQVESAVGLLDEGATVPFIARYRKEVTQGLDDTQLRLLEERLRYMRELDERRDSILKSIDEQGKLTGELKGEIQKADTKALLEDLYLPYKKKRRTKAQIAREAGLEPLTDLLFENPEKSPEGEAASFIDEEKGFADTKAVLDGARQILMERFSEDAGLLKELRTYLWEEGKIVSELVAGKENEGAKFSDYFDYSEAICKIPSHRALALFRGRNEGVLKIALVSQEEDASDCILKVSRQFGLRDQGRGADKWLSDCARWAWKVKISLHLEMDLLTRLREEAEDEAILVFSRNLRDLLLAAPAGTRATLALDPGYRTGVKVAVVDETGKLCDIATIYPHEPKRQWDQSIELLAQLCRKNKVELISIGNGTASRETDKLAGDLMKRYPELKLTKLVVSEAGASIYSASEYGAMEFPDIDVSIRGAISIGRRLQDPLAELVKIDPKSIGVGQYQHDVSQVKLGRMLDGVVEDCVNGVGVDLNTASVALLSHVSGLNEGLAQNIVRYREEKGRFKNRKELKEVTRLGPKAFEQAAGFLRIRQGDNPLDQSSVHPEAYPVVKKIINQVKVSVDELIGDQASLRQLNAADFIDDKFGLPTVQDIIAELEKPGRDPRPEFSTATFQEGIEKPSDLKPDMRLEGVVTNVTNFGAFVDVGVHQDGLVHISHLADKFVKDPHEIVKPGDVVKVRVLEVDLNRKRISLSMKAKDSENFNKTDKKVKKSGSQHTKNRIESQPYRNKGSQKPSRGSEQGDNALAEALAKAKLKIK
ncbi:transcriptional accessory protein [Candidatus Terasakiella magnetica]|uniref:Small ribosomal subunit protein bS1 n=1 Tax=Candidatus Terasakiella magnetica TaxID=1867952 RepID=A0A1C3RLE2_9PROT|nr:Tex family protein [Candidatus Terasakiella magnetica]SCA58043.1 transcriptional accessory protein [Candidatus Terasakiella magnetica]